MKLVIAEKPSVAREIARLLGASKKHDGYMSSEEYLVTWAFGHLLTLAMPEDYGWSKFVQERLPLIPDPFKLVIRRSKVGKSYKTDEGASKQLKIIEQLTSRTKGIIVATDAGREGELIFRYIYQYLNCNLPFERLWISSLTEKAIKHGLSNLRPGYDYDNLYKAGEARAKADWLVGINGSQALSIVSGDGSHSLGRVQTPTLALVCKRYLEHSDFKVTSYFQIQLCHKKEFIEFKSLSVQKWEDQKAATQLLNAVSKGSAVVVSLTSKKVSEPAPLLFDITGLQKECNRRLNLRAEETLLIAQSLYEKKFITYPRTGSKYIGEDVWEEIPKLIRALDDKPSLKEAATKVKWGRFNKHIVNDLRVTDHHGLLTTEIIPTALNAKENAVYEIIALRLLESVSHNCLKEITDVRMEVAGNEFTAKGTEVTDAGFRAVRGNFSESDEAPLVQLPVLEAGDELRILDSKLFSKNMQHPALYTEATLLAAMESAGKRIEDSEQRKAIQLTGIGTPATRAAIIETLFKRGYLERIKSALVPTEKGLAVYTLIKDKGIAEPDMTAQWELALSKVEDGSMDEEVFRQDIVAYTKVITAELLALEIKKEQAPQLICPKCKVSRLVFRDKVVRCTDEACGWRQYRRVCEVSLSTDDIRMLVETRKTPLIKGFKTKSGKTFHAYIILTEDGGSSFEFEKRGSKSE